MKTRILVEIDHDKPIKSMLLAVLIGRVKKWGKEYIHDMGSDCGNVSAHIVKESSIVLREAADEQRAA